MFRTGLVLALSGAAALGSTVGSPTADQLAVMSQEKAWSAAFLAHDLRKLGTILSDDFVGIDGRGVVSTKADELAEAAPPIVAETGPQLVREDYSDMKVRVYGRTAVLTDVNAATFAGKEGSRTLRYRRTTVWVKRGGNWRCVSFHATRLMDRTP